MGGTSDLTGGTHAAQTLEHKMMQIWEALQGRVERADQNLLEHHTRLEHLEAQLGGHTKRVEIVRDFSLPALFIEGVPCVVCHGCGAYTPPRDTALKQLPPGCSSQREPVGPCACLGATQISANCERLDSMVTERLEEELGDFASRCDRGTPLAHLCDVWCDWIGDSPGSGCVVHWGYGALDTADCMMRAPRPAWRGADDNRGRAGTF